VTVKKLKNQQKEKVEEIMKEVGIIIKVIMTNNKPYI